MPRKGIYSSSTSTFRWKRGQFVAYQEAYLSSEYQPKEEKKDEKDKDEEKKDDKDRQAKDDEGREQGYG